MRVGEVIRLATNEANSDPASRASNIHALCVHLQGALKFQLRLKDVSEQAEDTSLNERRFRKS